VYQHTNLMSKVISFEKQTDTHIQLTYCSTGTTGWLVIKI